MIRHATEADIPTFEASGYDTRVNGKKAVIGVPALSVSGFSRYAQELADDGASMYVNTQRLTVLRQAADGTETEEPLQLTDLVDAEV